MTAFTLVMDKVQTTKAQAPEVVQYGCTIRPDSSGIWFILDDDTHDVLGCSGISQTTKNIVVDLSPCYSSVITGNAVQDEIYANRDVQVGLKLGLCSYTIYLDKNGNLLDPETQYYHPQGNVWIGSIGNLNQ